jgi:hypothetical protein
VAFEGSDPGIRTIFFSSSLVNTGDIENRVF